MTKISSSPRTVRLMTALVLLATFAAGTVTGGGLVHWFASDADPSRHVGPPMLPLLELNLSEGQEKKVHAIFQRYRPKLEALLHETFPKVRAVNDQIERDVREVLTDEQRRILDHSKSMRHGPPLDGPPRDGPPPDGPPPDGPRPNELMPRGRVWPGDILNGPPPGTPPGPPPSVTAPASTVPGPPALR